MSVRQELAERIADFVNDNNLNSPYGGDVSRDNKFYSILFAYPRTLDGVIHVYSPKFIQVKYQTGYRALPRVDSRVFTSEKDALDFMRLAFVEFNFDAALDIPVKG